MQYFAAKVTFGIFLNSTIDFKMVFLSGSTANIAKFCSEVSRVLKPTGLFFIVSYGVPDNRLNYLEKEDIYSWTVTVHTVPKPTVSAAAVPSAEDANGVHYIYICSKGGTAEEG